MTASMPYRGENRRLSIGEEVLNAVTHGLGALLGVVGTIILIFHARAIGGRLNLVSVTVFGVSMILLYLISCLYHALPRSRGKAVFQVLDHCSIFLLIVGTYTPICLVTVGGSSRQTPPPRPGSFPGVFPGRSGPRASPGPGRRRGCPP